ncbi:MAG: ATP-binding protein [Cohaesibacter sp.]|nr:ATP-binding protein [Cohaesibacter sp.]
MKFPNPFKTGKDQSAGPKPSWWRRVRLWPRSLVGQLMLSLFFAVILSQMVAIFLFSKERLEVAQKVVRGQVLDRTASVVQLLNETDPSLHRKLLYAAEGTGIRYSLRNKTNLRVPPKGTPGAALARVLQHRARLPEGSVRVRVTSHKFFKSWKPSDKRNDPFEDRSRRYKDRDFDFKHKPHDWDELSREEKDHLRREWRRDFRDKSKEWDKPPFRRDGHDRRRPNISAWDMAIALPLENGQWLHVKTVLPKPPKNWGIAFLTSMAVMIGLMFAVVFFTLRKLTAPLRALERAATHLGRGETTEPLEEKGPKEIVGTIAAFNNMQERLMRFVQDRTRMLAAISHDLRTPITTLRLRAEFIDDEEMRDKILATLEEMQAMTEAVLAFAREDASAEETKAVDISALLSSIADDFEDMGKEVSYDGNGSLVFNCRAMSLKRAIVNLTENAVRYAGSAYLQLEESPTQLIISVLDNGPGIPPEQMEQVFSPFFRVEGSRNMETGGVGLGLSITRTIIRSHGGDILLSNRKEGGLAATITLPK